jgi:soluble lytic murein transglycosylase
MLHKKIFSLPVMVVAMLAVIAAVMIVLVFRGEHRYYPQIREASARYGHDPRLVRAMVKRESNFRPDARGTKGEIGLMQVTPAVGREYARARRWKKFSTQALFDPALNTEVGCWYLAKAMRRYRDFDDPVPFALAHYNAGPGNVDRWLRMTRTPGNARQFLKAITYPSTRHYVRRITRRWRLYRWIRVL